MNGLATKPTLTVQEVARLLGVSEPTVLRRLYSGELEGEKPGKSWVIPSEQIEALVADRDAEIEVYVDKQSRGEALARAAAEGYWLSVADVVGQCRRVHDAYDDFSRLENAEPVMIKERGETLVAELDALRDALVRRDGYASLATDAASLLGEAAELLRGQREA